MRHKMNWLGCVRQIILLVLILFSAALHAGEFKPSIESDMALCTQLVRGIDPSTHQIASELLRKADAGQEPLTTPNGIVFEKGVKAMEALMVGAPTQSMMADIRGMLRVEIPRAYAHLSRSNLINWVLMSYQSFISLRIFEVKSLSELKDATSEANLATLEDGILDIMTTPNTTIIDQMLTGLSEREDQIQDFLNYFDFLAEHFDEIRKNGQNPLSDGLNILAMAHIVGLTMAIVEREKPVIIEDGLLTRVTRFFVDQLNFALLVRPKTRNEGWQRRVKLLLVALKHIELVHLVAGKEAEATQLGKELSTIECKLRNSGTGGSGTVHTDLPLATLQLPTSPPTESTPSNLSAPPTTPTSTESGSAFTFEVRIQHKPLPKIAKIQPTAKSEIIWGDRESKMREKLSLPRYSVAEKNLNEWITLVARLGYFHSHNEPNYSAFREHPYKGITGAKIIHLSRSERLVFTTSTDGRRIYPIRIVYNHEY